MLRIPVLMSITALLSLVACSTAMDRHGHTSVGKVEAEANRDKPVAQDPAAVGIQPGLGSVGDQK